MNNRDYNDYIERTIELNDKHNIVLRKDFDKDDKYYIHNIKKSGDYYLGENEELYYLKSIDEDKFILIVHDEHYKRNKYSKIILKDGNFKIVKKHIFSDKIKNPFEYMIKENINKLLPYSRKSNETF